MPEQEEQPLLKKGTSPDPNNDNSKYKPKPRPHQAKNAQGDPGVHSPNELAQASLHALNKQVRTGAQRTSRTAQKLKLLPEEPFQRDERS